MSAEPGKELSAVHLVVLQHGLWGFHGNLDFLESSLQQHVASVNLPVRTLNSKVNEKTLTYDGVDLMGERLVALIKEHVSELAAAEGSWVTHLSFIGYSLGGLVARYAVGKLEHEGAFSSGEFIPMNFITVATPHLGAWRPSSAWRNRTFNDLVPPIASWSGYQLMFKDQHVLGRPLMVNLADPSLPFFQGLQRFKKLVVLANIHFDTMVPYRTAAISMEDPYEKSKNFVGISRSQPAACPDKFPSIRRPCVDEELLARDDQPPIGGSWIPIVALLLLPILLLPLLLTLGILIFKGRRHYKSLLHLRPESAWLLTLPGIKSAATPGIVSSCDGDPSATDQDPSATDQDAELAIKVLPSGEAEGTVSEEWSPSMSPHKVQAWISGRLNMLPWEKVGVDVRHGHAHAGIVIRIPSRFERRDHLQYLFDHCMEW